ncbi:MAG: DUF1015 family protein [Kiritimatiellia bacterium]
MRIKGFRALRPQESLAEALACPPYDTVKLAEAREIVSRNPDSFLRVTRPEVDLSEEDAENPEKVWGRGRENLGSFIDGKLLIRESSPSIYAYRIEDRDHRQTGIVCCCHTGDYSSGVIKRHEKCRPNVVEERARHMKELCAHTGPVMLMHRDEPALRTVIDEAARGSHLFDFRDPAGTRHRVWRIEDTREAAGILEAMPSCYIADGHHRAEAAWTVAEEAGKRGEGAESAWFLSIMFPADELKILPYHRCVSSAVCPSPETFLKNLERVAEVEQVEDTAPGKRGELRMYYGGRLYGLKWRSASDNGELDAQILQKQVLAPLLGIEEPTVDGRLEFLGGRSSTEEAIERVDEGAASMAFLLYPVSVETIMNTADRNGVLPPKSTWFEPKARSGLLIHDWCERPAGEQ